MADTELMSLGELSDGAVRPWYLRDDDRRTRLVYGAGAVVVALFGPRQPIAKVRSILHRSLLRPLRPPQERCRRIRERNRRETTPHRRARRTHQRSGRAKGGRRECLTVCPYASTTDPGLLGNNHHGTADYEPVGLI